MFCWKKCQDLFGLQQPTLFTIDYKKYTSKCYSRLPNFFAKKSTRTTTCEGNDPNWWVHIISANAVYPPSNDISKGVSKKLQLDTLVDPSFPLPVLLLLFLYKQWFKTVLTLSFLSDLGTLWGNGIVFATTWITKAHIDYSIMFKLISSLVDYIFS